MDIILHTLPHYVNCLAILRYKYNGAYNSRMFHLLNTDLILIKVRHSPRKRCDGEKKGKKQ